MPTTPVSRRRFLKIAGITLAATTVTCTGVGFIATQTPGYETPQLTYGKDNPMNKRVLITYATRAGSTIDIAKAMGETLNSRGFTVEVKPVKDQPKLDGYQAVILASPIRMGGWLSEAVDYIKRNQPALNSLPVALVTVHMLNTGEDETSRNARLAYLNTIRPLLPQAKEVFFTGKMDMSRLSLLDKFISTMVKSKDEDKRDWDRIRAWSQAVFA